MNLVAKTGSYSPQLAGDLHRFAVGLNPNVPVSKVTHLENVVGESVSGFRSTTWLFLSFAGVALVLVTIGIYGLVSWSVTQRAYEIALRMAIGGSRGSIVRMILMRSIRVSLLGLAAGLLVALVTVRGFSTLLFEVTPGDPLVCLFVSAFLLAVAGLAAFIPAWRVSRIDPVRILRAE
jgi:ABC-type antimicrobial peptide transport system permease subunit